MDFFEQQDRARAASRGLVWMYLLAVVGIVLSVHAVTSLILTFAGDSPPARLDSERYDSEGYSPRRDDAGQWDPGLFKKRLFDPTLFLWTAGLAGAVILVGTLTKIGSLRGGGSSVAESLGGHEVLPDTGDFDERRLLNVVEEMALAAGVRVPRVYVLQGENGINAFAAGYAPDDAAIAVTSGLLHKLNRDEIQAVVGHEFSHILNGDMRLNIRLIAVLGGILGLAVVGRVVMETAARSMRYSSGRRSSKKNDSAAGPLVFLLLGVALWIIGSIGVLFGKMIQSAVSRHREHLADSSAVQFTRNPAGLATALKLIASDAQHGALHNGHATEVAHMLFANGARSFFATHPPIKERIRRLDPSFDGDLGPTRALLERRLEGRRGTTSSDDGDDLQEGAMAGAAAVLRGALLEDSRGEEARPPARYRNADAGTALAWMQRGVREALREPEAAECSLYAALLSADSEIRERQLAEIRARDAFGTGFAQAAEVWEQRHSGWTPRQRRMACELAAETLRAVSPEQRGAIVERIDLLSRVDGQIDSFEFALGRMARRRLLPDPARAAGKVRIVPPASLAAEASMVLSELARFGSRSPEEAAAAWQDGAVKLSLFRGLEHRPDGAPEFTRFETALEQLAHLPPLAKREYMAACRAVVQHDGTVTEEEENFLVAIADAIDAVGWSLAA